MKIKRNVYDFLLQSCPSAPPETGGILGGNNGIITNIVFDKCNAVLDKAIYVPNIEFLNSQINRWNVYNIDFYGIFHTHISDKALSNDDKLNINKIMLSMPKSITKLFFSIIIPKKEMTFYAALRDNNQINIYLEEIDII